MKANGSLATDYKRGQKHGPTPVLRFPTYRDSEDWETKLLCQIATLHKGRGISKAEISVKGSLRCIRYGELYTIYGEVIDEVVSATHLPASALFLSQKNDVLIPASGETKIDIATASCITHDGIALGSDLNIVRTGEDGVFLSYLFNGALKNTIAKLAQGDAVVHLYQSQLEQLSIPLPSRREQRQIAECLSSLDELISAERLKLNVLQTFKKALLQQLFPAEGETLPRLRFPEFRKAKEWEMKKLGTLVALQSGGTPSKASPALWDGSIPWVSAKDMKRLFLDDTEDHISVTAVDSGAKLVPAGTVLILTRGMTLLKDVPICLLRREMSFNQDVKALRPKMELNGLFLALALLRSKQRLLRMVDIAGHGTGKLNTDELGAFEFASPELAEQQQIAVCLSSLDQVLAAQLRKVDRLAAHKKGLMQQLFPMLDEVQP